MHSSILVIDDNPADVRLLSEMLLSQGHRIFAATSGSDGFKLALAHLPALVLLDLRMPEQDGFAVCRLFKSDPRLRAVPIIFLTGSDDLPDKLQAFEAGGADYVTKPYAAAEVCARVRLHIHLHEQLQQSANSAVVNSNTPAVVAAQPLPMGLVARACDHVRKHLADSFTLTEFAHYLGTNEKRLSDEFRQATGLAVFEYLRQERLRRACELLLHSKDRIGDVALQVGYQSMAAFTFAFRERLGVTPSQYRQSAGVLR